MAGHGSRSAGRVYCRHYTGRNSLYHDETPARSEPPKLPANRDAMVAGAGAGVCGGLLLIVAGLVVRRRQGDGHEKKR